MEREYMHNQRLVDLRKEKGKTISEMAYESGLSASTISNYERGVRIPDGKALVKLVQYFGCSSDYLLGLSITRNSGAIKKIREKENLISKTMDGFQLILDKGTGVSFYDLACAIISHSNFKNLLSTINYYLSHDKDAYKRYANKLSELANNDSIQNDFTPEMLEEIYESKICVKFLEIVKYLRDNPPDSIYKVIKHDDGSMIITTDEFGYDYDKMFDGDNTESKTD